MTDPKVVHPAPEDGIDYLYHRIHWLADVLPEDVSELGKERRLLLHLWHKLRSPLPVTAQNDIRNPGTQSFRLLSGQLSDSFLR